MRKIVCIVHAGMCGTDAAEFIEVEDGTTDEQLNAMCWDIAIQNADMYGIMNRADYEDSENYDEEDESYSDDIGGFWEDYIPAKHDHLSYTGTPDWQ